MKERKMIFIGKETRIFPNYGVFRPGDEVDFNESLYATGLFREKNKKEGDE